VSTPNFVSIQPRHDNSIFSVRIIANERKHGRS